MNKILEREKVKGFKVENHLLREYNIAGGKNECR